jgi:hypothetical protein
VRLRKADRQGRHACRVRVKQIRMRFLISAFITKPVLKEQQLAPGNHPRVQRGAASRF